jgi:hypothetical protein
MIARALSWLLATAQAPDSAADFVAAARAATARYQEPSVALAAGYRPLGPDFPSMGEHWVNAALLVNGVRDVAHPPILEYAILEGRRTLIGITYAVLVTNAMDVPPDFPVPASAWHFHGGTLEEESFILSHEGLRHEDATGPRIAVLHAWVWLENPAGVFTTDNWALPFARFGLVPPPGAPEASARAAALAGGGDAYVAALARVVGHPDSAGDARVREVLAREREATGARLVAARRRGSLTRADVDSLAEAWHRTVTSLSGWLRTDSLGSRLSAGVPQCAPRPRR